jgi:hypothetical protein
MIGFQGKLNIYTCGGCHGHIVTKDVDAGTTPFMTGCRATDGCKGMMQSSMYRVFDQNMRPDFEWYRPDPREVSGLPDSYARHVAMGGLLLRKHSPVPSSGLLPMTLTDREKGVGSSQESTTAGSVQPASAAAAYTPGPWHVEGVYVFPRGYQSNPVAAACRFLGQSAGQISANARLIAAAPELLAVAKILAETDDETPDVVLRMASASIGTLHGLRLLARAAIGKATGEA